MVTADEYVIWSYEHTAFWGPGRIGYVLRLEDAGRYARADAEDIVEDANIVERNEQALLLIPTRPGRPRETAHGDV